MANYFSSMTVWNQIDKIAFKRRILKPRKKEVT